MGSGENLQKPLAKISVRALNHLYLAVASLSVFAAIVLFTFGRFASVIVFLTLGFIVAPLAAYTDRITFDGRQLKRVGLISFFVRLIMGHRPSLQLGEIELVETEAIRTLRLRGAVRYRYRTEILGKNLRFVLASSGKNSYRNFIRELLQAMPSEKLDARSAELRDYLRDERHLSSTRALLHIASLDVLEDAAIDGPQPRRRSSLLMRAPRAENAVVNMERAKHLQFAANEPASRESCASPARPFEGRFWRCRAMPH
ncbi:MAG: hypothetical protein WKF84_06715 [Pyrinomonadaceae bacterium]